MLRCRRVVVRHQSRPPSRTHPTIHPPVTHSICLLQSLNARLLHSHYKFTFLSTSTLRKLARLARSLSLAPQLLCAHTVWVKARPPPVVSDSHHTSGLWVISANAPPITAPRNHP